jgi:hypothetical protein
MDVHIPYAVTVALRLRGVDILTAQEDRADQLPDAALLDRALKMGRILFSQDDDLLREATLHHRPVRRGFGVNRECLRTRRMDRSSGIPTVEMTVWSYGELNLKSELQP